MRFNKRKELLTFISSAALLGLFCTTNSQVVKADTTTNTPIVNKNNESTLNQDKDNQNQKDDNSQKDADVNQKNDQKATNGQNNTDANQETDQKDTNDQNDTDVKSETDQKNEDKTPEVDRQNLNKNDFSKNTFVEENNIQDTSSYQNEFVLNDNAEEILRNANIDINSLNDDQLEQINKINFDDFKVNSGTQWTYAQYAGVAKKMIDQDKKYCVPYFNAKKIKNLKATTTRDAQTGKVASLDVWDSWPIQDAKTGKVVNYKGYQLAIAMMGIPNQNDAHIYLLYNKYRDNNPDHWKTAGAIFGYKANPQHQEWSGSATVNKNGSIQLFYTDVDTTEGTNNQMISTVNLKLKISKKGKVTIAKRSHRHVLFRGDGYYYQTYKQWKATNKGADNIAMRDAHVVSVNGRRYLIFEASTGSENYQGAKQVYNWKNYGGTSKEAIENFLKVTSNPDMTSRATWANAALGIVELSKNENNPKVVKVMPPLVNSLMVSDEIERPDLIKMNGKYYLFATTRLNRGTGDDLWQQANKTIGDNVAMLGWVSDHLTYGYEPLNGDAGVLVASVPFNWRTATYSYYAVPVNGSKNELLITSYMSNRGYVAGQGNLSTWAPSFLIRINPDNTTTVLQVATNQGDWVYDKKSKNNKMLSSTIEGAHLAGEPIENSMLKKA